MFFYRLSDSGITQYESLLKAIPQIQLVSDIDVSTLFKSLDLFFSVSLENNPQTTINI